MMDGRRGSPDDAALVREVATGSEDALAALYDRHADGVHSAAARLTDDRQVAEEVVQETFLALWNRAERFDPAIGSLAAWLYTIARNRTVDRLRAAGRRPRLIPLRAAGREDESEDATIERLAVSGGVVGGAGASPGPESEFLRRETRTTVRRTLDALPELERTAILLAYRDGMTQSEIAERLGWPLGTVKTRTRRALLRLREVLAEELGPELGPAPGPMLERTTVTAPIGER
jgi:RNA polymerase sigma-70 factor (ECF subfamily)